MQPRTAPPRDALTDATVVRLIRDEPAITVSAGAELLDMGLNVLADISDDFTQGGSVARNSYAVLHGTGSFGISRALNWGRAIVRPYMNLTDGITTARFNLGAYFTSTPERVVGNSPETYGVDGYDILHGLNSAVGEAYAVDAGVAYLDAVEAILIRLGYSRYIIDQTKASTVLPTARVWPVDQNTKWLNIVNDLLGAIGYQGIWSDWDGWLRVLAYTSPSQRGSEWSYTVDPASTMLSSLRTLRRDYFDAPNKWVAIRTNNVDGPAPVEGNGIYTYVNQRDGDLSVEARGNRIITRILPLDAADQASLITAAQVSIDADTRTSATVSLSTFPNPLHWHFDRLTLDDPDMGPVANVLSTQWTLPLNGADMTHGWTVL